MKMLADHLLSKGHISWLEIIETAKARNLSASMVLHLLVQVDHLI